MTAAPDFKPGSAIELEGDLLLILAVGTCQLTGTTYALLRNREGKFIARAFPPYFRAYTLPLWEAAAEGLPVGLPA